ncbi:MAG: hypothetical protein DDT34_01196 [Firmicutes bacterium]|nr:hypothetical protein [Bacillota bacterium]
MSGNIKVHSLATKSTELAAIEGASYQVAWMMLQRLRVAMVNSEHKPLFGNVEVDETC